MTTRAPDMTSRLATTILRVLDSLADRRGVIQADPKAATEEILLNLIGPNQQRVIEERSGLPNERLVRLVCPGHFGDNRLIRQVFDTATGTWSDAPISRVS